MPNTVDSQVFKRTLNRNVMFPLIMSALTCVVFVILVLNLLAVSKWVDHTDQVISRANETLKVVIDSETGFRGFLVKADKKYLEPYEWAKVRAPEYFTELETMTADNPAQVRRIKLIRNRFEVLLRYYEEVITGSFPTDLRKVDVKKDQMDLIRLDFREFIRIEKDLRDARSATTQDMTRIILTIAVLFTALGGAFLAFVGRKQTVSLSSTYEGALKAQQEQNQILHHQAWIRGGQSELSNLIKGENSIQSVTEKVLKFFADYTHSIVGTFYVNNDNGGFERSGAYAFTPEGHTKVQKTFKTGEGLVGQTAANGKLTLIKDVPDNYVKVVSSVGASAPKFLILSPVIHADVIQGVIELGFMEEPEEMVLELLNTSALLLGAAVKSNLDRKKLEALLSETQSQAEELQTQQEELRVSNEELSLRSRSLQDLHAKLENQHAELEQTNEELEGQKRYLDQQNRSLKEMQKAVEEKANELETTNRYKSEFLANMSHELRTPLNSTLILSKLLMDNKYKNLSEEQVEFASTIYSSGNDLLNLINDILDLSKVEAGKLDIYIENFAIRPHFERIRKLFQPIADQKKVSLKFEIDDGLPVHLKTDANRIEQILKNLLSNAIKFTEKGSVIFSAKLAGNRSISISVQDTGVGISKDQQNIIFDAFRQADGKTNRKYGGTGLGLSISKNLVELLGGKIEVESSPGAGSTFTITLPIEGEQQVYTPKVDHLAKLPESDLSTEIRPHFLTDDREVLHLEKKRVLLVVEDELSFAKILYTLAHERNYHCLVADTSREGFELAVRFRPDAIILDMKLPDAIGLSLLDKLKASPETRHIPVHAMSAMDYSREALQLGATGYLKKPTTIEEIQKTFTLLDQKINQGIKSVLIVEDDPVQRSSIEKLIANEGINITAVGFGKDAIKMLSENTYDCAVVDLTLPDMSGLELLEQLSQHPEQNLPPIIVYTGRSLSQVEEDKLRRYSQSIIIKGARSPERLLDEVALFLHQVETQLSPDKQELLKASRFKEEAFDDRTVLIVDDDARNIFALTSMLEQKGAVVIVARNGIEALEKVNSHDEIDLVLMDIMMPEMDGYTAMRHIRENPKFKKLPIIAVTAKAMRDDYEKCLEAGANDYLSKPINVDKLVSLMRVWIRKQMGEH
jgi:signal transduction histidine kinase/CheY-like chemotaxis protein/CHASE3 domain sensor protein